MLNKKIFIEIEKYIETHLQIVTLSAEYSLNRIENSILEDSCHEDLEEFIHKNRKPTLNRVLFGFIDKKGTSDAEIYKRAGIDRRHFSKIRSNPKYRPGKNTAIALALALELNKEDTDELLSAAGYSLSDSDTCDLVIQFCLEKKIYDMDLVNEALDHFSQKLL
ncbi:hypothetical protein [Peribacillus deserti]|uniref:Appr-1-p processing protein n=1 Tax=Peribacillus deserti TaxID=673318 RepID=A0A2N5M5Y7_9BACI|nr:hypothetical protein [Peribacillus deserti]PLT29778.1 hypothetical protein CUU66_11375 [Peribacillus deserti]